MPREAYAAVVPAPGLCVTTGDHTLNGSPTKLFDKMSLVPLPGVPQRTELADPSAPVAQH
jgi:hypothetical protein